MTKPETLERRYAGKMTEIELSIMKGLLEMDPNKRLTAEDALKHPYFEDILSKESFFFPKS